MIRNLILVLILFTGFKLPAQNSAGVELIAEGLTLPVALAEAPDNSGRIFITDLTGEIKILNPDGTLLEQPFLDVSDRMIQINSSYDERGLLGLAFHPDYAENGKFYIYYSAPLREEAPSEFNNTSRISEFTVSENPDVADENSERILLEIDQPQFNHAGGGLAFSTTDGYLYISLGDGGGANDNDIGHVNDWYDFNEGGNGQDIDSNLLGGILRIDVDSGDPYSIPSDNPFVNKEGLDEIYAYGFRNPYRFSFDMGGTNQLFVGDAGQDLYEEVSIVEAGGNYGWNVYEGAHCFDAENPLIAPDDCPYIAANGDSLIPPVIEFLNSNREGGIGVTVVGGYVYRDTSLPDFYGKYIFGAWSSSFQAANGLIFIAEPQEQGLWDFDTLQVIHTNGVQNLNEYLLAFGQDLNGSMYLLTNENAGPSGNTGKVYKLIESTATSVSGNTNLPGKYELFQNYPNPFNPSTTIKFSLPERSFVQLKIYDMLGREVASLINNELSDGIHEVEFNADGLSSGLYFYEINAVSKGGNFTSTNKMILMK